MRRSPLLAFAVYTGSTFRRYVRATAHDLALGWACELYGDTAAVTRTGPAFAPGAGADVYGAHAWDALVVGAR